MWRRHDVLLLAGGVALGTLVLLVVGGLAASAPATPPVSAPAGCTTAYHPVAGCAVPQGGTLDPCSLVTAGLTHCPFTLPDFNPGDWGQYVLCVIESAGTAIWNAVSSFVANYVETFFVTIAQDLIAVVEAPIDTLISALQTTILAGITAVQAAIQSFFTVVNSLASSLGPFAPIVVVTLTMLVILAGVIGLYFAATALFAIGKTLFNLL